MNCSKCGVELSGQEKFCPNCGSPLGASQKTVEPTKSAAEQKKLSPLWGIAVFVLYGIMIILRQIFR